MSTEKIHVLLVDDSRLIRKYVEKLLSGSREDVLFDLEVAEDITGTIALLEEKSFDLILLDLELPDSSGLDTLKKVYSLVSQIPIVVLTGSPDHEMGINAIKHGAEDYIVKDDLAEESSARDLLIRIIRHTIERKKLEQRLREAHDQLEQRVRERTGELADSNSRLNQEITERTGAERKLAILNDHLETLVVTRTEELAAEKELLTITLGSMSEAVIATVVNGRIFLSNAVAEELTGWKSTEMLGQNIQDLVQIVRERTREPVENPVDTVLRTRGSEYGGEDEVLVSVNKSEYPVRTSASPIEKGDGTLVGVVMVFRDISHEREVDRMKTDFVSLVSHELRTPLTSIKACAGTIMRDPDMGEDTRREFMGVINQESDRLAALIDDLLEVARIDSGTNTFRSEPVDIREVVETVMEPLVPLAAENNIHLKADIPDSLPEFEGDSDKMESVVTNLINNAIKFTPRGGDVSVSVQHRADQLILCVSDTGVGIPEKEIPRIFERFYRVQRSGERVQGTGLGLAIVRDIVGMHGGTIKVGSSVGEGSTFTVSLPLTSSSAMLCPGPRP